MSWLSKLVTKNHELLSVAIFYVKENDYRIYFCYMVKDEITNFLTVTVLNKKGVTL